ncbi:MAG: lipoprotein [Lysobacterales bacterium]
MCRTLRIAALAAALVTVLAACGNKGPLVKPTPPAQAPSGPTTPAPSPPSG